MKDTATFRKQGLFLAPSSRDARDIMSKLREGDRVFMQVWKPRNMAQHRKYFAVLNNVVEATGKWTSTEHLRKDILIALHLFWRLYTSAAADDLLRGVPGRRRSLTTH